MPEHHDYPPRRQSLTPAELDIELSLQTGPESCRIQELETFLSLQTVFMEKVAMVCDRDETQKAYDECDAVLKLVSQQFARTVQIEPSTEERVAYAAELLVQTLEALRELGQQKNRHVFALPDGAVQSIQEDFRDALTDTSTEREYNILEQTYGASCTHIIHHML